MRGEKEEPDSEGVVRPRQRHQTQGGGSGGSLPPPATCPLGARPLLLWARALPTSARPPPAQILLSAAVHLGCPGLLAATASSHGDQDGEVGVVKDAPHSPALSL